MKANLLLLLANHLENNVAPERFNLRTWNCGTTACAMGEAAKIPAFQELGYCLAVDRHLEILTDGRVVVLSPFFGGLSGFMACGALLDISTKDAEYLFSPDSYMFSCLTRKSEVIARIRAFVADHQRTIEQAHVPVDRDHIVA